MVRRAGLHRLLAAGATACARRSASPTSIRKRSRPAAARSRATGSNRRSSVYQSDNLNGHSGVRAVGPRGEQPAALRRQRHRAAALSRSRTGACIAASSRGVARHLKPGGVVVLQENNAGSTPATFAPMIAEAGLRRRVRAGRLADAHARFAHVLSRHHAGRRRGARPGRRSLMRIHRDPSRGIHDAPPPRRSTTTMLVAAVSEERLTRLKGYGQTRALARRSTRCCASPAGARNDVDAIALTRGFHPTYHLRVPLWRELRYAIERARGTGARLPRPRDPVAPPRHRRHAEYLPRRALPARQRVPRRTRKIHFANHHEAHALAALFYTDWDDALIYTSDGIGDNVSYSMRSLKDGKLDCHWGDDRWLTRTAERGRARQRLRLRDGRVRLQDAAPRGQAHRACGLWRAEARGRDGGAVPLHRRRADRDRLPQLGRRCARSSCAICAGT